MSQKLNTEVPQIPKNEKVFEIPAGYEWVFVPREDYESIYEGAELEKIDIVCRGALMNLYGGDIEDFKRALNLWRDDVDKYGSKLKAIEAYGNVVKIATETPLCLIRHFDNRFNFNDVIFVLAGEWGWFFYKSPVSFKVRAARFKAVDYEYYKNALGPILFRDYGYYNVITWVVDINRKVMKRVFETRFL